MTPLVLNVTKNTSVLQGSNTPHSSGGGVGIMVPLPNFVVSSSIRIKFGVLIGFHKFSPK